MTIQHCTAAPVASHRARRPATRTTARPADTTTFGTGMAVLAGAVGAATLFALHIFTLADLGAATASFLNP